jgi:hypothetical protein
VDTGNSSISRRSSPLRVLQHGCSYRCQRHHRAAVGGKRHSLRPSQPTGDFHALAARRKIQNANRFIGDSDGQRGADRPRIPVRFGACPGVASRQSARRCANSKAADPSPDAPRQRCLRPARMRLPGSSARGSRSAIASPMPHPRRALSVRAKPGQSLPIGGEGDFPQPHIRWNRAIPSGTLRLRSHASTKRIRLRTSGPLQAQIEAHRRARHRRLFKQHHGTHQFAIAHNGALGVIAVRVPFKVRISGEVQLRDQRLMPGR